MSPAPTVTVEYITGADISRISAALGAPMSAERIADIMAECGVDGKVRNAITPVGAVPYQRLAPHVSENNPHFLFCVQIAARDFIKLISG